LNIIQWCAVFLFLVLDVQNDKTFCDVPVRIEGTNLHRLVLGGATDSRGIPTTTTTTTIFNIKTNRKLYGR
jgi:hypothetical protein